MFDSPLCDRPFTQFPLFSNWGQFDWLKIPLLVIPLVLAFFGLRWITQRSRWKRQFSKPRGLLLLTGFTATVLLILAMADKGLVLFLPADSGTAVEAIVVLGRGTELGIPRIDVTAQLWKAKRAPLVFVSGTGDTPRMLPLLEEKGIPKRSLDGEDCSLTTPENALFSAAILQAQGIRRILLVTDGPHMWRSLLDFRDQGFTVIPHLSPLHNNMGFIDKAFLTFREYLFLISSNLHELFQGQRVPRSNSPELVNLIQQAKQYGQLKAKG
jgi:uncharacterized SAM-binding protein YcdF (DUF218 family)